MKRLLAIAFILCAPAFATNYTVKAGGGGSFTTMAACASQMSTNGTGVSDTCTVFAGTYNESVTIPAGSAGNYKIFTVNGSDVVSVLGFTLNSHTKLIGNCPAKQGTVTTATCGFFVSNTSSPSTGCASLSNGVTDVYIRSNVFYACGTLGIQYPSSTSYIYIQGNTVSYTNSTIATVPATCLGSGSPVGNSVNLYGDHQLIENNDFSHYTLSVDWTSQYTIMRNNVFHDTVEANNAGNCHSDAWFSEPGVAVPTQQNLIEGNIIQNLNGPNAKGILAQADTACGGDCFNLIERFNVSSRIGSGFNSNNGSATWGHLQIYNNTVVDAAQDCNCITSQGDIDNSEKTTNGSFLNQVYFMGGPSSISGFNMYACSNGATNPPATAQCTSGHSLYFCSSITCTTVYGPEYEVGTWLGDPGNQVADPKFVNYAGVGNGANNYHLQATSPAIAAGTYLTTVASGDSGSGTSLVVTDASYFQDGYGLTNAYSTVSGDCISVTTVGNHVCVTGVNYSTNTLTLASGFSRSNGDHVWLYSKSDGVQVLTGSAPDLGAYPYSPSAPSSPICAACSLLYSKVVLP